MSTDEFNPLADILKLVVGLLRTLFGMLWDHFLKKPDIPAKPNSQREEINNITHINNSISINNSNDNKINISKISSMPHKENANIHIVQN